MWIPGRVYNALLDRAQQQYGFLTPGDARELDVDPAQLRLMASRGTLQRRGRGIYRVPTVPATDLDGYMEAVLWTGGRGVLSHETALDLLELCDVNPGSIHLTVPPGFATRKRRPDGYRLHLEALADGDVHWHEGIPIVSAHRAILGGLEDGVGSELIEQAVENARARGAVTREQHRDIFRLDHLGSGRRDG